MSAGKNFYSEAFSTGLLVLYWDCDDDDCDVSLDVV